MVKLQKSFTLDREVVKFIEKESKKQDRSESYIVNEIILKEMVKKK